MIDRLDKVLEGRGLPGLAELRELLGNLETGRGRAWRLVGQEPLQPPGQQVFRLCFAGGDETWSLIAKRLRPPMARRNELVARRWLPTIGLARVCPLLLGSVAARDGSCIWHLYEDLGSWEWDVQQPDRDWVRVAIALIAQIHTQFANHGLLGEIRMHGTDYGTPFIRSNTSDAISALRAVKPPAKHRDLCTRLLERLHRLREELPGRSEVLTALGGPETLLHGDLWTINVCVKQNHAGLEARLIDWDHAGVGPASYDLSTFLLRFSEPNRTWVLGLYQEEVERHGWRLPAIQDLELLFETAELARYANRVIWPAIAIVQDGADWGFAELAEVETWFENLAPVLPSQSQGRSKPE